MLMNTAKLLLLNVLSGGGNSLLPFSDSFDRADGDVGNGWDYSAGVWTIASNNALASPSLGPELITNGDMETGDPPSSWTVQNSATLSGAADERTGGAGAQSMNAARGSADISFQQTISSLVTGAWYRTEAWMKNVSATRLGLYTLGEVWGSGATWGKAATSGVATAGAKTVQGYVTGSSGNVGRFDDISFKRITLADCFATRNAQTPNVRVKGVPSVFNGTATGLVVALDSVSTPQSFVVLYLVQSWSGMTISIDKYVSGTRTSVAAYVGITYTAGDEIALEYQSGIVRVFRNSVQIGQDYRVTDAAVLSNIRHGLFGTYADSSFLSASLVAAAAPIALNGDTDAIFTVTTAAANLWTSSGGDDWLGRAVLADDGTNWIALYRSGTSHTTAGKFHVRFSNDDGVTWSNEDTVIGGGAVTGAPTVLHGSNTNMTDGIVLVAPNDDLLIQIYENGASDRGTYQYRSTDGGATWTDEGRINADATMISGQDYTIVGSDIYLACMEDPNGDGNNPYTAVVYKSSDSGASWAKIGTIESDTAYGNEPGIIHTGGNNLLCVMRDAAGAVTYQYTSSDLGVTWSARSTLTELGIFQRPRMKALAGGIMMFGRDEIGVSDRTVVWYSPDNGTTWGRKFWPDPTAFPDCGYCDVLERADGKFYMLTYGGSTATAVVRHAVFEIA